MAADPRQLIGGYATGNLDARERRALLTASLEDQALFDTLVYEEALREAIEDGGGRALALEAFGPPTDAEKARGVWAFLSFRNIALAAGALAAIVGVILVVRQPDPDPDTGQVAVHRETPGGYRVPEPASPGADEPAAPAVRRLSLDRWLAGAPLSDSEGVVRLSPDVTDAAPAGAGRRRSLVPAVEADRRGFVGFFALDGARYQQVGDWVRVSRGQVVEVPAEAATRELRVVIVESEGTPSDDQAVVDAVEGGRGAVYRVERN